MKLRKLIMMLSIRITIFILLLFWIGIFKSLVFFGETHLYEPNKIIAIIELGIVSLSCGWFGVKSFKEIKGYIKTSDKVKMVK